jgi:hypothetical protein
LNSTESPYRVKNPTSKAQFKKLEFQMPNYKKKPKLNSTESPYRVKSQLQKPNLRSRNFKCQTTRKSPNTEKAQIEFYRKPI